MNGVRMRVGAKLTLLIRIRPKCVVIMDLTSIHKFGRIG